MLVIFTCITTYTSVFASNNITTASEKVLEEKEKTKTLAEKAYEKMQEKSQKDIDKLVELEVRLPEAREDGLDYIDRYTYFLNSAYYRLLIAFDNNKELICILFIIIGLFFSLIFRKDKAKMKWGYRLCIFSPIIYFSILFAPAIADFFKR